jgi:hypothetical protein
MGFAFGEKECTDGRQAVVADVCKKIPDLKYSAAHPVQSMNIPHMDEI